MYVAENYFRNFNFNFNYRKLNSKLQNPLFLAQHDIGFEIKDQGTGAVLLWSYCSGALVFNFKPTPWGRLRGAPARGAPRSGYVNLFPPSPFPLSFSLSLCTTVQDSAGRYMNMQDATWGMYLNVRYFPYPKICFSYLKIRQAVHFESLRFHAHFVLLCSSRASLELRFCRV